MQQAPLDSRLASLGLLLGAGMIGYSFYKSRQGVGPLSAGPVANAPGLTAAPPTRQQPLAPIPYGIPPNSGGGPPTPDQVQSQQ